MAQLRSVTCHMGSHSVTCYPTQVNTPRLNPSHAGRYSIYLPRREGRLSWPSWLDSAPAGYRTSDLSIMSPTLNQCNHQHILGMVRPNHVNCMLCFSVVGYGCHYMGCSCRGWHVPAARSQRSSYAGEVYAQMQCANYQVSSTEKLLMYLVFQN